MSYTVQPITDRNGVSVDGKLLPFAVMLDYEVTQDRGWALVTLTIPVTGVVKVIAGADEQEILPEDYWEDRERRSVARYEAAVADERQKAKRFLILTVIRVRHELGLDPSDFVGKP